MPAIVATREPIADDVTDDQLDARIKLMLKAGCVRSFVQADAAGKRWLVTEWNVIGAND
jgi:hypothetical protein